MLYKGKTIELISTKEVFGKQIAWIRVLEDNSFLKVAMDEIEMEKEVFSIHNIRFVALAAKIKDELAKKKILAPYESSLIPLPHQILVLEKVMKSGQNRFLLADEVGMGKTIETGLIMKELQLRGNIKRVLVIVPKSSMLQWQSELKEHFNEVFHVYDSEMITSLARTFSNLNADEEFNFWTQHKQIIVSTDALKPIEKRQGWSQERVDEYNKYRMEAVLDADFDLVVIDEAHKMGGATSTVSRYILAQELCNTVANVLLLTATPHRGKSDHFRRILQLLDPDAFAGEGLPSISELESYVIRTEKRHAIDYDGNKLFKERKTQRLDIFLDSDMHGKQLGLYSAVSEYVRKGFNSAKRSKNNAKGLIMVLFQRLVSSSTAAILSAMEGRLERMRYGDNSLEDYIDEVDSLASEYEDSVDFEGIYQSNFDGLVDEESLLCTLIDQAKDCMAMETDAKADALLQKLKELQQISNDNSLKIIVFTEFRSTQKMLFEFFMNKGYECSIINGSQDLDLRKRSLANFKNESQILIATDAAGESLNMQFCHIVFNYDLPWNPMMIEQRIGRVDRIGQKHIVQAYNMLTNNSVDLRVYEVIEEKLNNIIDQLGIDKTSDVLDSAIDMKKVNRLYLQSLLDPEKFEFASDKWLFEIRSKLKDYHSTEGILPKVAMDEIDSQKASEIKYSPLPHWLDSLVEEYVILQNGSLTRNLLGYIDINDHDDKRRISFDSEVALNNPDVEHLTVQHTWIKKILSGLSEFDSNKGIPIVKFNSEDETAGYWSLWQISAQNQLENKVIYQAFFLADNGKQYSAYANEIWNRLLPNNVQNTIFINGNVDAIDMEKKLNDALFISFQNLEVSVLEKMNQKKENKIKSYDFEKSRINKIGIENIKISKLHRLEKEYNKWLEDFERNQKLIPGIKQLLSIRIDVG